MGVKEELLKFGFLSGSQFYGTAWKDSDIDIVINIQDKQKALKIVDGLEITDSEYNGGCYVQTENEKINCIFVHPDEYHGWFFATVMMRTALNLCEIDRPTKCNLFQIFVKSFNLSSAKIKED